MVLLANCISVLVIVFVGYMIFKKVYPTAALFLAGIILLAAAIVLQTDPGILGKGVLAAKKSTGLVWFDIFKIIEDVSRSTVGGLGMNIMVMGGFAAYMDKLEAGRALFDVVGAPLKYIKNPYLLAGAGFCVDQVMGMAIPSAAGLGLLMMVTMYPVLIRAGVSRMTAVCTIAAGRFYDLGPGSASCNMTAKTAGIEWADYFINWQMVLYPAFLITILVSMYFCQKWWDKHDPDPEFEQMREKFLEENKVGATKVPKIYALLTLMPLCLLLFFNKIVALKYFGIKIAVTIPTAVTLTIFVAMVCEFIRTRDGKEVMAGLKIFFQGMGKYFGTVVALIIAGQIFGKGLTAIGSVQSLIEGAKAMNMGVYPLIVIIGIALLGVAFLMGSGNAPYYSFAGIAPAIAKQFGFHTADILHPLQNMTAFGRTMSPVTGGIVACAGIAGVSPFRIVKRNAIPLILVSIVNLVGCYFVWFAGH